MLAYSCRPNVLLFSIDLLRHPQANTDVEGVQVPLLIARDWAYLLLPLLMQGFSGPNLSEEEEACNIYFTAVCV